VEDGGAFRWLIPARFVEKKGHAIALRAFKQHLASRPESLLTCWGYGDSAWLRKEVERFGLGGSVSVLDNSSEGLFDPAYLQRLRDHDAVLAPSVRSARGDDEGGPALTAVLAQVAGKPVIVSDFPGHERSVTDGLEGLVVPQGDAAALAAAMADLASDRERARAMGIAGRERAIHSFDRQIYRDTLIGWYRSLAK
jgi:glycosyltransferase involved in cell wall biosynthesis